jgi:hypothetical protein
VAHTHTDTLDNIIRTSVPATHLSYLDCSVGCALATPPVDGAPDDLLIYVNAATGERLHCSRRALCSFSDKFEVELQRWHSGQEVIEWAAMKFGNALVIHNTQYLQTANGHIIR